MALEDLKSVVFNKITDINDSSTIYYQKLFLYNEVKDKLKHNLTVMPKDNKIKGAIKIWVFDNKMMELKKLTLEMDLTYNTWKTEYDEFVRKFSKPYYVYYIETKNEKLGKMYETIIALLPKKSHFNKAATLIKNTEIERDVIEDFSLSLTDVMKGQQTAYVKRPI